MATANVTLVGVTAGNTTLVAEATLDLTTFEVFTDSDALNGCTEGQCLGFGIDLDNGDGPLPVVVEHIAGAPNEFMLMDSHSVHIVETHYAEHPELVLSSGEDPDDLSEYDDDGEVVSD